MPNPPFRAWDRNERPLQTAGGEHLVAETYIPARGHNLDTRIILHVADLEAMLEVAKRSRTGRLVIQNASIRIREYRSGDHTYSCLTLCGSDAIPEDPAILIPRLGQSGRVT